MRIDKYICDTINITRTQAKQKIAKGAAIVNGKCVKSSSFQVDEKNDVVFFDGVELTYNKFFYIMMNKPSGVISASSDKKLTTAIDLLSSEDKHKDLFVAGRLDKDTTGFLLITNDGDFAHNILSPKNHVYKTYSVLLEHCNIEGYEQSFKNGVVIDSNYKCKPARFEYVGDNYCNIEICEGKFHQVKRMFESLGNRVLSLKRIKMGDLSLDPTLDYGEYRYLNDQEIEKIMNKMPKKSL